MRTFLLSLIFSLVVFIGNTPIQAQTVELLGFNTLNGALNGTLLGASYMGLDNNAEDFTPLRIGLGFGTLYGIGVGGYDIVNGGGNEVLVSGFFNDGNNTSIIVLMDTFYGLGSGAVIATAVTLISGEPILEGVQYGASAGAFVGFAFGLVDAFAIAKRTSGPSASLYNPNPNAPGLVSIDFENRTSVGLINPSIAQFFEFTSDDLTSKLSPNVQLVNFKIKF